MSNTVSYGNYNFDPAPFLDLDNESIFLSGQLDYLRQNVGLIGQLTGCDLTSLKLQRDELVEALTTGFQQLTVGNTGFTYAKPISISFRETDMSKILPYEVNFEAYQEQDFSQLFGILNPIDIWTFSEKDERVIAATHEVSAVAVKTDADSLQKVRDFVDGRMNGFEAISLYFSGDVMTLDDKAETLNRLDNSYGVTETWSLSTAIDSYDTATAIVRPAAQIDYDGDNLTITVNGTIKGGISGAVSTGDFTPEQALEFAQNSTRSFKSILEEDYYDDVFRGPSNYQYTEVTGANSINFTFNFADPNNTQTGDVNHDFTVDFTATKVNPVIQASIRGRVFYDSYKDIFLTDAPEEETRYKKVEAYFSGVNPFALTQQHFNYFNEGNLDYSDRPLETRYETYNINKSPFSSQIEYEYTYNNQIDIFSGQLFNPNVTITCEHSIPRWKITPTVDDSFCVQELFQTRERKSISVNGIVPTGVSVHSALLTVSGWMEQYSIQNGTLLSDSCVTGNNRVSLSKTYII